MRGKLSVRARVLAMQAGGIDWDSLTREELIAFREKTNRVRGSRIARLAMGFSDRGARIVEREIVLQGRSLTVRVHRPRNMESALPLILQFHGGGFAVGTAAQNDWLNSRLAARCPAVVASLEYRLAPEHPLPAAVEDACDTLTEILRDGADWGIDPDWVAVMGESAGGTLAALAAIHARDAGLALRAQVLLYPCVDLTEAMFRYPSIEENADNPILTLPLLRAYRRFSLPATLDARSVSPLMSADLGAIPPTLIQTAQLDPLEDQGRAYADRLRAGGTDATLTSYPDSPHGFLSTPGLVSAAKPAAGEVLGFLRSQLRIEPASKAPSA